MSIFDPQHEAVREATAMLKEVRYWSRSPEAQRVYLDHVTDLVRELAFILNQAGVTWADVERLLAETRGRGGVSARLLQIEDDNGGRGVLEFALCKAVDAAKAAVVA